MKEILHQPAGESPGAADGTPISLVIFHYHLKPGGVTSVILLGIRALIESSAGPGEITIVSGSGDNLDNIRNRLTPPAERKNIRLTVLHNPDIGYSDESPGPDRNSTGEQGKQLAADLLNRFGGRVWWIHNYHLGKNPVFTQAVLWTARSRPDQPMLLQIHDFPESGRFENLSRLRKSLSLPLYPSGPRLIYLTINRGDRKILLDAGLSGEQVFCLNNPVDLEDSIPDPPPGEKAAVKERMGQVWGGDFPGYSPEAPTALYPVRTIRRKNVLEAGLITLLSPEPLNLLVSLPGVSPQETAYSLMVEELFRRGIIPGIWGSGALPGAPDLTFAGIISASDFLISSSVQEGFGYLFINAGQWNKPLLARRLDVLEEILSHLRGVRTGIYRQLSVPWDINMKMTVEKAYRTRFAVLGPLMSRKNLLLLQEWLDRFLAGERGEFSYLPVLMQKKLLETAAGSASFRQELRTMNDEITGYLYRMIASADPAASDGSISPEDFGLPIYGSRIGILLDRLTDNEKPVNIGAAAPGDEGSILDAFIQPEYQRLLLQPFNGGGD